MATVLTKKLLQETIETIQQVYMEDNIPWICGYSGGKDSSAVVQLVWMALQQLPKEKRACYQYGHLTRIPCRGIMGQSVS